MTVNKIFTPIESRIPISKVISSQIEEAILNKNYEAGAKLPSELELCKQFGASRTSVREALQALSANGLISIVKGKGIFVNKINSETVINPLQKYLKLSLNRNYVLDLVHARQILEPAIAASAAVNHTKKDIERLRLDISECEKCDAGYVELARIDMKFHYDLALATHSEVIPLLLKPIQKLMPELKSTVYATVEDAKESAIIWHTKIIDAVEAEDPVAANQTMTEHLKIAEKHAEQVLAAEALLKAVEEPAR